MFLLTFSRIASVLVSAALVFVPSVVSAGGIWDGVGCSGVDCGTCHVVRLANGVLIWLIAFLFLVFTIVCVIAGFNLVTSRGNPSGLSAARQKFLNAIIGLILVFASWIAVDTIVRGLVSDTGEVNGRLWTTVECFNPTAVAPPDFSLDEIAVVSETTNTCSVSGTTGFGDPIFDCSSQQTSCQSAGNMAVVDTSNSTGHVVRCQTLSGAPQDVPAGVGAACDTSVVENMNLFGKSVQVHKDLKPSLERVNQKWQEKGGNNFYEVRSVGGYNCRNIKNSSRKSWHSHGFAVDINSVENPMGDTLVTDMPDEFVELFKEEGYGWGGDWRSKKDAMHFSKGANEGGDMNVGHSEGDGHDH